MNKKIVALVLVCVLIFSTVVAGTLAFLMDSTEKITNTFTFGNVDIELDETEEVYKLVPGSTTHKDPKVTVAKGSEDCWVFVEVEESANLDYFVDYTIDDSVWEPLDGVANVYFARVEDATTAQVLNVLAGEQVTANDDIKKDRVDAVIAGTETAPTLAFTAYAVQYDATDVDTEAKAWAIAAAA